MCETVLKYHIYNWPPGLCLEQNKKTQEERTVLTVGRDCPLQVKYDIAAGFSFVFFFSYPPVIKADIYS